MALLTKLKFSGKVESLLTRPSRDGGFEKSTKGEIMLTLAGPMNDCHTGETRKSDSRTLTTYPRGLDIRNVRQLTLLSVEELSAIAKALDITEVKAEWLGANIVVSGISDLSLLPPSTRMQFPSGATIVVDMENLPCSQIDAVVARYHPEVKGKLVKTSMHKRGVTAWVEREGAIRLGDDVNLFIPPQRIYSHGQ